MKITIESLTKHFGKITAVDNFSALLPDGQLIALLGPSGCGKSTILNILAGILPADSGRIVFDEQDVTHWPPEKRGIGLVFQNYALYPHMTVMQNICFPLEIQKVQKDERIARATEIAKLVHVETMFDRRPGELSGGQQQRVAIARALVKRPSLLLLDEPLSNLDARLRLEMREEIRRIQQQTGVTTLFVTHDQEEAMSISDSIILMRDGVLQQYDKPQKLYNDPKNQFIVEFLGNPPVNKLSGFMEDSSFVLEDRSASVPFPAGAVAGKRPVTLAIRAESFVVSDSDGALVCAVESIFEIGKEEIALLRLGSSTFRAFISSDWGAAAGGEVRVGLKEKGIFLFDSETGERYV